MRFLWRHVLYLCAPEGFERNSRLNLAAYLPARVLPDSACVSLQALVSNPQVPSSVVSLVLSTERPSVKTQAATIHLQVRTYAEAAFVVLRVARAFGKRL